MLSSPAGIDDILQLAPEWKPVAAQVSREPQLQVLELFNRLGAKSIYMKALSLAEERGRLLLLVRDFYLQPHLKKMLGSNQALRRFWSQRRVPLDQQRDQVLSFSSELAAKMEGVLIKRLNQAAEDGFKTLLLAYIQRSVHNAVVDYIREEWGWERQTLQDLSLDPEQDDPRQVVADDIRLAPEQKAISGEQVGQLNQLRQHLEWMLKDPLTPKEPLEVVDCMFGMGLTRSSSAGEEMTMRQCCDKLNIGGETQARRIARCQVLLDKGLDMIRQSLREKLPDIVENWQGELNVNSASRRELEQQLGMTEGEVARLIKGRQFYCLAELADKGVVKEIRLSELTERGAVAAFVPIDINSATAREITDILGIPKEAAQKIASERPFAQLEDLSGKNLLSQAALQQAISQGAVLRKKAIDANRIDLNKCELQEIISSLMDELLAKRAFKGRPFSTWADLDEFLGGDPALMAPFRQKFCLGIIPG